MTRNARKPLDAYSRKGSRHGENMRKSRKSALLCTFRVFALSPLFCLSCLRRRGFYAVCYIGFPRLCCFVFTAARVLCCMLIRCYAPPRHLKQHKRRHYAAFPHIRPFLLVQISLIFNSAECLIKRFLICEFEFTIFPLANIHKVCYNDTAGTERHRPDIITPATPGQNERIAKMIKTAITTCNVCRHRVSYTYDNSNMDRHKWRCNVPLNGMICPYCWHYVREAVASTLTATVQLN